MITPGSIGVTSDYVEVTPGLRIGYIGVTSGYIEVTSGLRLVAASNVWSHVVTCDNLL